MRIAFTQLVLFGGAASYYWIQTFADLYLSGRRSPQGCLVKLPDCSYSGRVAETVDMIQRVAEGAYQADPVAHIAGLALSDSAARDGLFWLPEVGHVLVWWALLNAVIIVASSASKR